MAPTSSEQSVARCPECDREVSRKPYCEHCGALLSRALVPASFGVGEATGGAGEFRLEIDASRVLQQDAVGVLEMRLTNTGAREVQLGMVEMVMPVVDAPLRAIVRDIRPGRHMPLRFSVMPMRHGEAVCRVCVKALDTTQVFSVATGEFTVTVNAPYAEETTLQFVIKNSDVVGDFENVFTQKRRRPRGVMQPRRRATWVPVRLVEVERREVRPVHKQLVGLDRLAGAPRMERAALRMLEGSEMRTVALLAKEKVAFGRSAAPDRLSRVRNDVVVRLMPDTAGTRDVSRRIHRFAFEVRMSGDEVQLARLGRHEGRVAVESVEALGDGEPVDVAGLFELVPRIIKGPDHLRWGQFRVYRGAERAPEIELAEVCVPSAEQVLGVVFTRTDDGVEREEYVLVRRHVTIGASAEAAIVVAEPGVADVHARLIAKRGIFFVEDLGSAGGTWLNDRRLQPDEVAPLVYGDHVLLGKASLAFEPFEQRLGEDDS